MFKRLSLIVLAATGLSSAHVAATGEASEEARVVEALETMYVALTRDDLALFEKVVTADFYTFDGGLRMNTGEFLLLIRKLHAAGRIFVWKVTEPVVELHGDVALITYTNRGSVQEADGTKKDVAWLESALLRKDHGAWRIRFFHSTRVPPPK
jgi:ketosteroid isomerase-like protein